MSIWDICFDMINRATHASGTTDRIWDRKGPTHDFAEMQDISTHQTLRTQNLKKPTSNTAQVIRDRQTFKKADIIWVWGPDGQYSHKIDVREDQAGNRTGELYALRRNRNMPRYVLPGNEDVKLEDLLQDD